MNFKLRFFILAIFTVLFSSNFCFGIATVTRANLTFCSSVSFSALGTITVSEADNDDFDLSPTSGSGAGTTYNIMYYTLRLPAGFEFNPGAIPTFAYSGAAANFVNESAAYPFNGSLTEVQFAYRLLPNADTEQSNFTITGLQVKCITPGALGNMVRVDSPGDDGEVDGVPSNGTINHGTLSSQLTMYIGGQTATLPFACKGQEIYIRVDWPTTAPAGASYTLFEETTSIVFTEYYRYSTYSYIRGTLPDAGTNKDCRLEVTAGACAYGSNTVRINLVQAAPAAGVLTGVTPPTFTTFSDPVPMSTYVNAAAGTTINYMYTTRDGLYSNGMGNSGSNFFFLPSTAGKGEHVVNYQVRDNTTGCYNYFTLPDPFVVVDPLSPNPTFVSPQQTPLCEDNGYYRFTFTAPFGADLYNVRFHYNGGDSLATNTGGDSDMDLYLNPKKQKNYMIPVTIGTSVGSRQDTFFIFPKREVSVQGLPTPVWSDVETNTDTIYICSASKDTVTIRGVPSAGNFEFYKIHSRTPSISRYTGGNLGTPYSASTDPSTYKFVPNTLFTRADKANSTDTIFFLVRYNYPALGGGLCAASKTIYLKFYRPTNLSYEVLSPLDLPYCFRDTLKFRGLSVPGLPVQPDDSLSYSFGDGFSTGWVKADDLIARVYSNPGEFNLRVKTKRTGAICNNDNLTTVRIGAKPVADFDIYENFKDNQAHLISLSEIKQPNISDKPGNMDTIFTWSWDFGTNAVLDYSNEIDTITEYTYTAFQRDPYAIIHKVQSGWGCVDSIIKYTPVFEIKTPDPAAAYYEDFNDDTEANSWFASGWYQRDTLKSSWENIAANGNKIQTGTNGLNWITSKYSINNSTLSGVSHEVSYENNEISWVESPVFNLEDITLPMISFDNWVNSDNLFDGASLQYTICDSVAFGKETWKTLGTFNSGYNWYNSFTVISKPGGSLHGWTADTSNGWSYSAYRLNDLRQEIEDADKELVRFRIIFSSNGDNTPNKDFDGFAFDNFFIGQRNRRVLVEEFCDFQNYETGLDTEFDDPQAIRIQYHVRTHTSLDSINIQNPAEPSARALLYGVGEFLPRGVIDGILEDNGSLLSVWGPNKFFNRTLLVAPFEIEVTPSVSGGQLHVSTEIRKTSPLTIPGPFVVQIAIVEKEVTANSHTFTNVLRNMVPNSAGHRIRSDYDWSTDTTITVSWSPFIAPESDLMVVVFIQDENTKEIYQSNYDSVEHALVQNLPVVRNSAGYINNSVSFTESTISPNPTSDNLLITFNGILKEKYSWKVVDGLGEVLKSDEFDMNISADVLNTSDLATGMYYLMIEGEGQRIIKKFTVIK